MGNVMMNELVRAADTLASWDRFISQCQGTTRTVSGIYLALEDLCRWLIGADVLPPALQVCIVMQVGLAFILLGIMSALFLAAWGICTALAKVGIK